MRSPRLNRLFLFAMLFVFMIILPEVMADSEQYLTLGIDKSNTYQQSGTGVWTGRAGTQYTRTASFTSVSPLVDDLNSDGINEIITLTSTGVQVLHQNTSGIILITEYSQPSIVNPAVNNAAMTVTPALFDYNSDGDNEIIVYNSSFFYALKFNGTNLNLVLNQSAALGSGAMLRWNLHPVIKCAGSAYWADNKNRCVIPVTNTTGVSNDVILISWNTDDNTISKNAASGGLSTNDDTYHNTHLCDLDGDGYLDILYTYDDVTNGDLKILKTTINSSGGVTQTPILTPFYFDNNAASYRYTDIICSNLDGTLSNGMEVTYGYSDGTNWYGKTLNQAAAVLEGNYCTILNCPEGESASRNLIEATDTTYCDFSGDVYYYVRNIAQSDPGANIDTVHCLSLFAGAATKETTISNTVNFTSPFFIHQASLFGTTGILTPKFGIQGSTKQSLPLIGLNAFCIPVDYQISGTLDFICQNTSILRYFDDAYTNQNTQITMIAPDTGNPICSGETLTTTLTINDNESDAGNCYIRVVYANMTDYGNYSNTSFSSGTTTVNLFFTASPNSTLNLIHYYECKDQYHSTYNSQAYSVTYSGSVCGSGACNCKGYGTPVPISITTNASSANQMDAIIEDVLDPLLGTGPRLKTIAGIGIVIGIIVAVAQVTLSPFVLAFTGIAGLILVTFLGLLSAYILIIFIIFIVMIVILWKFVTGFQESG